MTRPPAPRRWTYTKGKVLACYGLSLAAGHAVATIYGETVGDVLQSGLNLGVFYGLAAWLGYRYRSHLDELLDLFIESNAHLFLGGFLILCTVFLLGSAAFAATVEWIEVFAPGYVALQGALVLFACTRRGADRLCANALALVAFCALCAHPHAAGYTCVTLALGIGALVFEHFDRTVAAFQMEDRQYVRNPATCALFLGASAALLFLALYEVVPPSQFKVGVEYRAFRKWKLATGGEGRPTGGGGGEDGGGGAWGDLLKSGINGAALIVGIGLVLLAARELFRRGGGEGEAREEEEEEEETEVEVPLGTAPSRRPRSKTWAKTPRELVIEAYLALAERLRRHGLVRSPAASPAEYAAIILARAPDLGRPVAQLTDTFRRACYGAWDLSREEVDSAVAAVTAIEKGVKTKAG